MGEREDKVPDLRKQALTTKLGRIRLDKSQELRGNNN